MTNSITITPYLLLITMRVVDTIKHPVLKITIFHLNDKYAVKIENGPYEQIYKFRDSTPLDVIKGTINEPFLQQVASIFKQMHSNKMTQFEYQRNIEGPSSEGIL